MIFLIFITCSLPFLAVIADLIAATWGYEDTLTGTRYRQDWEGGDT